MVTLESLAENIQSLDRKIDRQIGFLDQKIDDRFDELAAMTARGFLEASVRSPAPSS